MTQRQIRSNFALKTHQASERDVEAATRAEDLFVAGFGDDISCARVADRLWFGDMGAAIGVATGSLTRFTGVVNASGSELVSGVSMSDVAMRHRSRAKHNSAWDYRGIALDDRPFLLVPEVIRARLSMKETRGPSKTFVVGRTLYSTFSANHFTRAAFHVLVMRAADKITMQLEDTSGDVLVHCYAGLNRSAACVVAYLMLRAGSNFRDALRSVETAARRRGLPSVLGNEDFRKALLDLPPSLDVAEDVLEGELRVVAERTSAEEGVYVGSREVMFDAACSLPECGNYATHFCSGCMRATYCCEDCQKKHWSSAHRFECEKMKYGEKPHAT